MKKPHYDFSKENEFNTFGKNEFRNANTGEVQKIVNEDWRTLSQKGGVSYSNTEIDPDSTYAKYLQHLPDYLYVDYLTLEQIGDNQDLVDRLFGRTIMIQKCYLAPLPEKTLQFLVERYK